jgi:hypothetical protein
MEKVKQVLLIIGNWLLGIAKACWEEYLKEKLHEQLTELIRQAVNLANIFYASKSYEEKRDFAINFVMDKVKLPLALRPFKWLITKILRDSIDKEVSKLFDKLKNIDK